MLEASGKSSLGVHVVHSEMSPKEPGWSQTLNLTLYSLGLPEHLVVESQSVTWWGTEPEALWKEDDEAAGWDFSGAVGTLSVLLIICICTLCVECVVIWGISLPTELYYGRGTSSCRVRPEENTEMPQKAGRPVGIAPQKL